LGLLHRKLRIFQVSYPVCSSAQELEGASLRGAFHSRYFSLLQERTEDSSYPRLPQGSVFLIIEKTKRGNLIPVRATRQLVVDQSYGQFMKRASDVIAEHEGRMYKSEVAKRTKELLDRIPVGHMHSLMVGNFSGPYKGIRIVTDDELVIEPGTLGAIENIDWDFFLRT